MHNVLIKKGVAVEPTEGDNYSEFYPELYVQIKKHILVSFASKLKFNNFKLVVFLKQSLEKNWITKTSYQQIKTMPYAGFVGHLNFQVKLADQFIVTRQSPQTIEIFNRWTLASESVRSNLVIEPYCALTQLLRTIRFSILVSTVIGL